LALKDDIYKRIKKRVQVIQSKKPFSDADMAKILNRTPSYYSRYIKGNKMPGIKMLKKLDDLLEKELDRIKEEEEAKKTKSRGALDGQLMKEYDEDINDFKSRLSNNEQDIKKIFAILENMRKIDPAN
jgi:transcriptional regulator with XRE-family HTH domain